VIAERARWRPIIRDLALHLGSALTLEQVHTILDGAERDLARLDHPADFWETVEDEYEKVTMRLQRLANQDVDDLASAVRALIVAKRPK
jgi:hypothetical protein